jgi:hypothetical protein
LKFSTTKKTLFQTLSLWNLILSKTSFSHLKNLQHLKEISSTPPTHLETLLLSLQPCKLKTFPQKDSPFLCFTSKHLKNSKKIGFPKTFTRNLKNFSYTSNFNVGNVKNLKTSLSHFWTWNLKLET